MQVEILPDADQVAESAAEFVAHAARQVIAQRGRFLLAVSGGTTPWAMLRALARLELPWPGVHVVQVDERAAPAGHAERNLTHLRESLLAHAPLSEAQIHAMSVEDHDLERAARTYAATLAQLAGPQPAIDLVHLGLGTDGHTASLVPGDAALEVLDRDVAATGVYQGRRRLTLTYPLLNRARQILWLVTGESKARMLRRLSDGDATIPAGRVASPRALVLADAPAASQLDALDAGR